MGNRANYVVIEHGQPHIYFTRWGALNIPAALLSGPEATLAYARQLTPAEELLDNVWAEGGVLLDTDARRARFWGGNKIARCSYLRRPLLAALPLLWPGWSIDWALFGVADLARAIGWDIARVLEDEYDDVPFLRGDEAVVTEQQLLEALQADALRMVLTIRWKIGEVADYRFAGPWFVDPKSHDFAAIPTRFFPWVHACWTLCVPSQPHRCPGKRASQTRTRDIGNLREPVSMKSSEPSGLGPLRR